MRSKTTLVAKFRIDNPKFSFDILYHFEGKYSIHRVLENRYSELENIHDLNSEKVSEFIIWQFLDHFLASKGKDFSGELSSELKDFGDDLGASMYFNKNDPHYRFKVIRFDSSTGNIDFNNLDAISEKLTINFLKLADSKIPI